MTVKGAPDVVVRPCSVTASTSAAALPPNRACNWPAVAEASRARRAWTPAAIK